MRKTSIWVVTLVVAGWLGTPAADAQGQQAPRNVILIGWDGAQRDHVNECLARGELPNLKRLAAEGTMVNIDIVQATTDTKAGWAEILTGYGPKITGVYSNGRFQAIPEGYTIFERLRGHFGADKIATVAVIGKAQHVGDIFPPKKVRVGEKGEPAPPASQPAGEKKKRALKQPGAGPAAKANIVVEDGVRYRVTPGGPYYHTHKNVDVWERALMLDAKVGAKALEMLEKYKDKPFFFFVHFAEVDHKGHKHGENSKEYNDALISNDTWTGRIMARLKELNLYDKTLIYVTADHGFDEDMKSHKKAPHVFLGTNDTKVTRGGSRFDVAATIMARFGLDLGKIDPPLTGRPLTAPGEAPTPGPAPQPASAAVTGRPAPD